MCQKKRKKVRQQRNCGQLYNSDKFQEFNLIGGIN